MTLQRSNEFSTRITNRWKVPSFHNGRHDYYLCHNSTMIFIMIMIMMIPRCQHCRCPWRLLCLRLPPRPLQIKAQANVEGAPGIFYKSISCFFCKGRLRMENTPANRSEATGSICQSAKDLECIPLQTIMHHSEMCGDGDGEEEEEEEMFYVDETGAYVFTILAAHLPCSCPHV